MVLGFRIYAWPGGGGGVGREGCMALPNSASPTQQMQPRVGPCCSSPVGVGVGFGAGVGVGVGLLLLLLVERGAQPDGGLRPSHYSGGLRAAPNSRRERRAARWWAAAEPRQRRTVGGARQS